MWRAVEGFGLVEVFLNAFSGSVGFAVGEEFVVEFVDVEDGPVV